MAQFWAKVEVDTARSSATHTHRNKEPFTKTARIIPYLYGLWTYTFACDCLCVCVHVFVTGHSFEAGVSFAPQTLDNLTELENNVRNSQTYSAFISSVGTSVEGWPLVRATIGPGQWAQRHTMDSAGTQSGVVEFFLKRACWFRSLSLWNEYTRTLCGHCVILGEDTHTHTHTRTHSPLSLPIKISGVVRLIGCLNFHESKSLQINKVSSKLSVSFSAHTAPTFPLWGIIAQSQYSIAVCMQI